MVAAVRRSVRRRMKALSGNIGILGGTFNPVHLGHLILAESALEAAGLDRVLWVPCSRPPHKGAEGLAGAADRWAMVRAAIRGHANFCASDIELKRGGVSYAIDTVCELRRCHPRANLFFIIGSDTLAELHGWKDIGDLLERCTFVSFARPGYEAASRSIRLPAPWPRRLMRRCHRARLIEISSSDIRRRRAAGRSIRYLVPPAVERYIGVHNLYGNAEAMPPREREVRH